MVAETLAIIEADPLLAAAGLAAFSADDDRLALLSFSLIQSNEMVVMATITDRNFIRMLKGFTQTVFLLGYIAGSKGK